MKQVIQKQIVGDDELNAKDRIISSSSFVSLIYISLTYMSEVYVLIDI